MSGGISMTLSALPSRLGRDLRGIATSPTLAVVALLFIAGSVSLVAFFPRAEEQTVATSGEVYTPPTETIDPDQLAEFKQVGGLSAARERTGSSQWRTGVNR
jgi:hypothetical protein